MAAPSLTWIANRAVSMPVACRAAGVRIPDVYRDSGSKMYCPWGQVNHPDGGQDPAFRVWPDHAWCFACSEWFSPVKLAARVWEVSYEQAAIRLLDYTGYKPADYAHHWQEVCGPPELDRAAVSQALRNYCAALVPQHQLTAPLSAEYMSRCLGFLTQVSNEAEAAQWLELSKQVMQRVLQEGEKSNAHQS